MVRCAQYWKVLVLQMYWLKSKGSSNPANVVKATIVALTQLRDAATIARQRGVSLDVVFNG